MDAIQKDRKLNPAVTSEIHRHQAAIQAHLEALNKLAMIRHLPSEVSWVLTGSYLGSDTEIITSPGSDPKLVATEVRQLLRARSMKWKFNERTGNVEFTIRSPFGNVMVKGTPTKCEVERVEVEEEQPPSEAITHKRVTFRLKDPACLGKAARVKQDEEGRDNG